MLVNQFGAKIPAAGGGGAFSPADLFASAETGAYYDFTDTSNLYQTNTTSTPVTGDGQNVGYVTDLSGNGNHLTQATAAYRPTYKTTNGGEIIFSTDQLYTSAGLISDDVWTSVVYFKAVDTISAQYICSQTDTGSEPGRTAFTQLVAGSNFARVFFNDGIATRYNDTTTNINDSTYHAVSAICNGSVPGSERLDIRTDNGSIESSIVGYPFTPVNVVTRVGSRGTTRTNPYYGYLKSILIIGRVLTSTEMEDLQTWLETL